MCASTTIDVRRRRSGSPRPARADMASVSSFHVAPALGRSWAQQGEVRPKTRTNPEKVASDFYIATTTSIENYVAGRIGARTKSKSQTSTNRN